MLIQRTILATVLASSMALGSQVTLAAGVGSNAHHAYPNLLEDAGLAAARAATPSPDAAISSLDSQLPREIESNNTAATATTMLLSGDAARIQGTINAVGDVDYFSITAQAGDRLFTATTTSSSADSGDTVLSVIAPNGTTILETDNDDGVQGEQASSIAGLVLPTAGTYYLRVSENGNDARVLPYRLYAQLQRGVPLAEVEPNDISAQALSIDGNHFASGSLSSTDQRDFYKILLNAGDTVMMSIDEDPERDGTDSAIRLNFGEPSASFEVSAQDPGSAGQPDSQFLIHTVRQGGVFYKIYPDAQGGAGGSYHLSVTVFPALVAPPERRCYSVNNPGNAVTPPGGEAQLPLVVNVANPGFIDDVNISFSGTANTQSDISLRSPDGIEVPLYQNLANSDGSAQLTFDDEAATPVGTPALGGQSMIRWHFQPQGAARLSWFDGTRPNGTWQLIARDDAVSSPATTIINPTLTICERPVPPTCPSGTAPYTAYTSDFETSSGGMTHSGAQDQWAQGLPSGSAIADCASGSSCWKTNLTGNYASNSIQNLVSSPINLAMLQPPLIVNWAQKYQLEAAAADNFTVDAEQVGGAAVSRLFEHIDGTMQSSLGSGPTTIDIAAGWAFQSARVDEFAGQNLRLRFRLDSNATTQFAGAAIDDVSVTGCRSTTQVDASVAISDGTSSVIVPSGSVTYQIVASNPGPADTQANLAVTFGTGAVCTWTATYSNNATGAASGSGNIAQTLNMPFTSQAFFTAVCHFPALQSGTTTTTATLTTTGSVSDTNLSNNTASDTNTFLPANDTMYSDGFE